MPRSFPLVSLSLLWSFGTILPAQSLDIPVNGERQVTTSPLAGLPASLGAPQEPKAVFRLSPLVKGRRYEVTLTFDGGTDIGYSHAWVDGNPFGKDWSSFVGIGTGTGSRPLPGKQEKFLFTVDPASTSKDLFLALRSSKPFTVKVSLSDRSTGVTPQSKDRWGYYYVKDFDAERTAPFKLVKGGTTAPVPAPATAGPWLPIPIGGERQATTSTAVPALPTAFGAPSDPKALFRLGPLLPGKRYEATFTYDAGSDIGFAHSWVDGNPLATQNWANLIGIGTGTGTRTLAGKEDKFLFTVDPSSTSRYIYLVLRSSTKPFTLKVRLREASPGLTNQAQDRWGYYYVSDFDADRTSPFKLIR